MPDPEPDEEDGEAAVVEDLLVAELDRPERVAAGAAEREAQRAVGPVALRDDEEPDHLADGEGDEGEVMPDHAETEARQPDHHRGEGRRRHPRHRAQPGGHAVEVPQQHGGVGPDPEEGAVAQGDDVVCDRETQVGSMLPKTRCRSATQRAADRAGVDERAQAVKNHPGQSPMPTGGR